MDFSELYFTYLSSPIGELELCANNTSLLSVLFVKTQKHELQKKEIKENPVIIETRKQLQHYFNNEIQDFNLPLEPGGTEFQKKVWKQLLKIPFGKTINYLALAKKLGNVKSIRAAASANGKNPISIIIPCHRVIGSNNKMVGYSGDLWRKQWLLEHEEKQIGNVLKLF